MAKTRTYYTKKGKGHISPRLNRFVDTLVQMGKKTKKKVTKKQVKKTLAGTRYSADADAVLKAIKERE